MRNQGIAKYALKLVLKKATAKRIKQVLLICEDDNLISKHIIEKFVQRFGGYFLDGSFSNFPVGVSSKPFVRRAACPLLENGQY